MNSVLNREFDFFLAHQEELVQKYRGRYVVIRDEKVIGDYPDAATAVFTTQRTFPLGTFLVQKADPGPEAYTQRFHSRVSFA